MDKQRRDEVKEVLNSGHCDIHGETYNIKNLLLVCKKASLYAEEQGAASDEEPEWSAIFKMLADLTERVEKAADDLFDAVWNKIDETQSSQTREIQRKAAVVG